MSTSHDPAVSTTSTDLPPDHPDAATVTDWLEREARRLRRALAEVRADGLDAQTEEEDLGEVASSSQHPADVASETLEREVDLGLIEDFEWQLAELEDARRRVAAGTYGLCERCGTIIDAVRLEAVPATRFCRPCAVEVELRGGWRITSERRRAVLVSDEFLAHDDTTVDDGADVSVEEEAV